MNDTFPLQPGERILWTGKPDPMGYFAWKGRSPLILGLICLAVWLLLILGLVPRSLINEQRHFGALILVLGCMNLAMSLYFFIKGRSMSYAITDRRALIGWNLFSTEHAELPFDQFAAIEVRMAPGRNGHVLFLTASVRSILTFWNRPAEGFIAVGSADDVGRMLKVEVEKATGRAVDDGP